MLRRLINLLKGRPTVNILNGYYSRPENWGRKIIETWVTMNKLASSRRSVSWGIARKHSEEVLSLLALRPYIFARRLEEANLFVVTHVSLSDPNHFQVVNR